MTILNMLGLGKSKAESLIEQLTVDNAHELRLAGRITLIDVRKPEEWNEAGRPQGSHGITLQDDDFNAMVRTVMREDLAAPVAFTCKTGGRSSMAAEKAIAAGHTDVSNVKGGFQAWEEAGLPVEEAPF